MEIVDLSFSVETQVNGVAMLEAIERAGRTCYKSEDKITAGSATEFVRRIITSGHHSVLEHQAITVRVVCDRGVSHEIVRHRLAAYSQESTRYCNYGKGQFGGEITLCPMMDGLNLNQVTRRHDLWELAERVYLAELAEGIKPQQARDNLPTCLKTEIVITYNLREWRHFFSLRTAAAAHPQMRRVATAILVRLRELVPVVFDDVEETDD